MGHLDGRINADNQTTADAGVKDGPSGQPYETAPKKDDAKQRDVARAPDVMHSGDRQEPGAKSGSRQE